MKPTKTQNNTNKEAAAPTVERRRIGVIVHDERGNASVRWHDAPPGTERPVLEILGGSSLSLEPEKHYDPYSRSPARQSTPKPAARTDLRKLSEWIKMMRELEARKRRDGDPE